MKSLPATFSKEKPYARANGGSALHSGLPFDDRETRAALHARLLDEVSDAVISTDMQMIITSWNRAAERCYGWTRQEAIGKNANELLKTVYVRSNQEEARKAIDATGAAELEIIHTRKDGTKVNIASRVSLIMGSDGAPIGIVGIHSDITEKKRQEQALAESERKYQDLVKHAPAGIYEVDFQKNRFVSVNDAMCKISGYSREELLRMNPLDLLDAQSKEVYRSRTSQWLGGHKPQYDAEYTVVARDGREIIILLGIHYTLDGSGKPLGAAGIMQDITELRRAEAAMLESERKYQELVKFAPAGIYEIDFTENRYVSINDVMCQWTGYSREEMLQMKPYGLLGIRSIEVAEAERRRWMSGEKPDPGMEYKAYTKDGKEIYALLTARFKRDESGKPVSVTVIAHNITERRRAEEALRESERKYKELVQYAPAGIFEVDFRGGRFLSVNDAMCQITGYSRDELLQLNPIDMLDGPSRQKYQQRTKRWLSGEEPETSVEFSGFAKDGRQIIAELSVTFTRDECGNPKGATIIAHDVTKRRKTEEALRRSDERLQEELDGTRLLQSISTELILEDDVRATYEKLLDTALKIMKSDFASLQMLDDTLDGALALRLLASRGFGDAAKYWEWVQVSAATACGEALRSSRRVIVPDIEKCDYMRGTEEQKRFLQLGIHSCQSTPLASHTGKIVGMISTQWKNHHEPTERQLRLFDVFARQAADFIERRNSEAALRESEARLTELSRNLAAEVDALRFFHQINTRYIRQEDIHTVYRDIMDAAISLSCADCGMLQLAVDNGQSLELAVHTGLSDGFVRFFRRVSGGRTACEKVLEGRARVIVEDVSESPVYDDASTRKVVLAEGIRCVQSTPLFSGAGNFTGVLSTHYKSPHEFNERELRVFDLLARQAADVIERVRIERELKEREEQARLLAVALEKKNRLVTDFFINISHEFKTPLTILMLGVELLEKKMRQEPEHSGQEKSLAVMKQNCYRLSRLVSNLLDITKLDAGFMEPSWELRNIVEWVSNLVQSTEFYAKQRGLALSFESSAPEKHMFIDGFMLDRIVLNLLSNAIKHTPSGGAIGVNCRVEEGGVTISVRDTGEGIPHDKQSIIFDRFSQVNTSFTRGSEGTGIGLALAKSLVDLLGGRIWFISELGSGSEFFVYLPSVQRSDGKKAIGQIGLQLEKRVQMELSDIT